MIRIAQFQSYYATTPAYLQFADFDALVDHLGRHVEAGSKEGVPLFCPVDFVGSRSAASVSAVHIAVLDVDKLPLTEFDRVVTRMLELGVAWLLYTTWSNATYLKADKVAFRLVISLDRSVAAQEWPAFWARLNALVGGVADRQCKDPSRMFHYPSHPIGDAESAVWEYTPGEPLCVDDLLGTTQPVDPTLRDGRVTMGDLKNLASKLVRRANPHYRTVGERLRQVAAGESFADIGERDKWIFRITSVLADEFPEASAEGIAACFAQSLAVMSADSPDCPTTDDVAYKVRRHQNQRDADEVADENRALVRYRRQLRDVGRSGPYTENEVAGWCQRMGVDSMDGRWVVQKDRAFWLMVNGSYAGPYTSSEVVEAAETRLSPARPMGISVWDDGDGTGKPHRMRAGDLVSRFGSVAERVDISLTAQWSSYVDCVLTEAPCPIRTEFEPAYDERVDGWLRAMAGPARAERLLDWVSVLTALDEPCAALYLEGPKGVGKGLLSAGLSQLWSENGPTPLERVLGSDYNTLITQCPLLFADEIFPVDARGRPRTGELRQLVQARTHVVAEKYVTDRTLKGCVRVIIAANNRSLLSGNADLTQHDIAAIVDRVLHIPVCSDGEAFLNDLSPADRADMATRSIACHALWLAEHRQVARGHRFLVSGDYGELHTALTVDTGLRSAVCNWLVQYLLDPGRIHSTGTLQVRVTDGDVLVTSRGLLNRWDSYATNQKPPRASEISQALSGLSDGKRQLTDETGRRTNYWRVATNNLAAWADNHGYATPDQIADIVATWASRPVLVKDAAS